MSEKQTGGWHAGPNTHSVPHRARKERAKDLVRQALSGDRQAEALKWLLHGKYSARGLENFISRLESALNMNQGAAA